MFLFKRDCISLLTNIAKVMLIQVRVHFLQRPLMNLDCSVLRGFLFVFFSYHLKMKYFKNWKMGLSLAGFVVRRTGKCALILPTLMHFNYINLSVSSIFNHKSAANI